MRLSDGSPRNVMSALNQVGAHEAEIYCWNLQCRNSSVWCATSLVSIYLHMQRWLKKYRILALKVEKTLLKKFSVVRTWNVRSCAWKGPFIVPIWSRVILCFLIIGFQILGADHFFLFCFCFRFFFFFFFLPFPFLQGYEKFFCRIFFTFDTRKRLKKN